MASPGVLRRLRSARKLRSLVENRVYVGERFSVGKGAWLWAPRHLVIGDDVSVGANVRIEVDGSIGHGVLIANGSAIVGRTDHELQSHGVTIRRAKWVGDFPELSQPVRIGSDVWIGFGAIILSGVSIGESSVIGAGAIVTKDIPANSIAVGNPARVIGERFPTEEFETHWRLLSEKGISRFMRDV